jgi:putative hydrolase of the HAD superfamily
VTQKKYKLVSFDMFQTLVDVDTQKDRVLRLFFADRYTSDIADHFWADANAFVYAYFHRMADSVEPFHTTVEVFESCYKKLFPAYSISMAPRDAALALAAAHNDALPYNEVSRVLPDIRARYRTCLISDTDDRMVASLLQKFAFDRVYTSESYRAYKFDRSGVLFRSALRDFGVEPGEMLHIGDGTNDVLGAKLVGADAVWVNRTGREWHDSVRPDYVVRDLSELEL